MERCNPCRHPFVALVAALALSGLATSPADADPVPTLAADIHPTGSSSPSEFAVHDGKLYFQANDGTTGKELWRYDPATGTAALAADIHPTSDSHPRYLASYGSGLYFQAHDATNQYRLWTFDGTNASLAPDTNPTPPTMPEHLSVFGGALYFGAQTTASGKELWKYDGTTTSLVANLRSGSGSSHPSQLTEHDGKLYFRAIGDSGVDIYEYDGIGAPTPIGLGPATDLEWLLPYDGDLYFSGIDSSAGCELFRYDGATSALVADIWPGIIGSTPRWPAVYGDDLYFQAWGSAIEGAELWKYSADTDTASLVADIGPADHYSSSPQHLTVHEGKLTFAANDGSNGFELWQYDGSTLTMHDIRTGSLGSSPQYLSLGGNTLYFQANDGSTGAELWQLGADEPPVVDAGGPYGGLWGDVVVLDGSNSRGPAGDPITSWQWDIQDYGTLTDTDGDGRQEFTIPPESPQWAFGSVHAIVLTVSTAGGWTDTDTTSLTVMPEPASLAFLALGLLALARRRSRQR